MLYHYSFYQTISLISLTSLSTSVSYIPIIIDPLPLSLPLLYLPQYVISLFFLSDSFFYLSRFFIYLIFISIRPFPFSLSLSACLSVCLSLSLSLSLSLLSTSFSISTSILYISINIINPHLFSPLPILSIYLLLTFLTSPVNFFMYVSLLLYVFLHFLFLFASDYSKDRNFLISLLAFLNNEIGSTRLGSCCKFF
ncbi:unnamed protein product [Acanthosepion pharaonis]|uniref:Uncharacterized protein n=1 Tax=Acanthosepion pharaonis TaxID=158019 RepID=A0A812BV35_ACAPH|nr:unnamed protein product [Sepia pharaonis]